MSRQVYSDKSEVLNFNKFHNKTHTCKAWNTAVESKKYSTAQKY